jgi:ketosteroid isomerase-like protein
MPEQDVEVVRRAIAAWNEADMEAWLATADENVEWRPAMEGVMEGDAGIYRGEPGLREVWKLYRESWAEFRIEPIDFRVARDRVVFLGHLHAVGRGSGIAFDTPLGMVFTLREGRITGSVDYLDHAAALESVGLR